MATKAQKAQRRCCRDERKDQGNQTEARTHLKKKKSKKPLINFSHSKDSSDHSGIVELITVDSSDVEELDDEKQTASFSQSNVIEIDGEDGKYDEISPSQELEFEENNQANDMMSLLDASINALHTLMNFIWTKLIKKMKSIMQDEINKKNFFFLINFIRMKLINVCSDDGDTSGEDEVNEDEPLQALWSIFENPTASSVRRKLKSGKFGYQKPVENPNSSSQKLTPAIVHSFREL
ncbi:hypothetical protein PSTG_10634 [Puccinia striiformis f. sp. tritici PST-78]|uniref:Uncharacterized protein n=1 Tax=Puccinia striiformis f. sp. tritici PST-78 TaxID=1165861 RepID=A0A0L0V9U7_9BASI|nr:hypothetical protein PSTG_10634 [Puccinia striiformis f. sp. tritici PST-78]